MIMKLLLLFVIGVVDHHRRQHQGIVCCAPKLACFFWRDIVCHVECRSSSSRHITTCCCCGRQVPAKYIATWSLSSKLLPSFPPNICHVEFVVLSSMKLFPPKWINSTIAYHLVSTYCIVLLEHRPPSLHSSLERSIIIGSNSD